MKFSEATPHRDRGFILFILPAGEREGKVDLQVLTNRSLYKWRILLALDNVYCRIIR